MVRSNAPLLWQNVANWCFSSFPKMITCSQLLLVLYTFQQEIVSLYLLTARSELLPFFKQPPLFCPNNDSCWRLHDVFFVGFCEFQHRQSKGKRSNAFPWKFQKIIGFIWKEGCIQISLVPVSSFLLCFINAV